MPLPIIIGAAIVTGLVGAGKGVKAVKDNVDAKSVNQSAEKLINDAKNKINQSKSATNYSLKSLGKKKVEIIVKELSTFVEEFQKIKEITIQDSIGINELRNLNFNEETFEELKSFTNLVSDASTGLLSGSGAGALAAFGAYNGVMALGTASTGTAISTLSGAAATNATLAWLGGGSIAAGGGGVAMGTMVLGGVVAGPALMVTGFIMGAKAKANLDNAFSNLASAKKIVKELELADVKLKSIKRRSNSIKMLLIRLSSLFNKANKKLSDIIENQGCNWSDYSEAEQKDVFRAVKLAQTIKALVDTPLLDEDGNLIGQSESKLIEIKSQLADL